jgi:hypothetical protein
MFLEECSLPSMTLTGSFWSHRFFFRRQRMHAVMLDRAKGRGLLLPRPWTTPAGIIDNKLVIPICVTRRDNVEEGLR